MVYKFEDFQKIRITLEYINNTLFKIMKTKKIAF